MKLKYIKVDETKYWKEEFVKSFGADTKIISTYIYDEESSTHCAELKSSFWMEHCGSEIEPSNEQSEDERNDMHEEFMDALHESDDSSHYRHCSSVKGTDVPGGLESIESAVEEFNCNPW